LTERLGCKTTDWAFESPTADRPTDRLQPTAADFIEVRGAVNNNWVGMNALERGANENCHGNEKPQFSLLKSDDTAQSRAVADVGSLDGLGGQPD